MDKELKDQRITIMLTPSELKAVDDWSFDKRIRSRGEAIRQLINRGLAFDGIYEPIDVLLEHGQDLVRGVEVTKRNKILFLGAIIDLMELTDGADDALRAQLEETKSNIASLPPDTENPSEEG